jgi:VanZ family protein
MEPVTPKRGRLVARMALAALLAAYWLSLFLGTHIHRVPQSLAGHNDKLLHLCAYGGLSVLLLAWRISRGPASIRTVAVFWLLIAGYGAFDELTQILVGRQCDFFDWTADLTGAAFGLAVTWPVASWLFGRMSRSA